MLFGFAVAAFLMAVYFFVLSGARKNRYWRVALRGSGRVRHRIVKLPARNITHAQLLNEIRYFNGLHLVAEVQNGVAAEYTRQMNALLSNIGYRPFGDAYTKLFYAYAVFVLMSKSGDYFVRRRLHNNLRWVFTPRAKIVRAVAEPRIAGGVYYARPPVRFKVFTNSFADMTDAGFRTEKPLSAAVCDSFIVYRNADIEIKRYDGFYDIRAKTEQTVTFTVSADKTDWDCVIARGSITAKNLNSGETKKYKITGAHIRLGSSIADKTDALEIYVTVLGRAGVSADGAVARLLPPAEIEFNRRVERIAAAAYNSKFVSGENLRARYLTAAKEIPSLRLPTLVYEITDAEGLLRVLDDLECYKRAAKLFGGLNIVFLYSSGSDFAAKLVAGFVSRDDIACLYQTHVFAYFIDRATAGVDTIYYLSKMAAAGNRAPNARAQICINNDRVTVNELHGRTYPHTKTVVLQNADRAVQSVTVSVPVCFSSLSAVSVAGRTVTAAALVSGRCDVYSLPPGAAVPAKNEFVADKMTLVIKAKLSGYEQRKFQIIKNEGVLSPKERKNRFIRSIENIRIDGADAKFNKIFTLPAAELPSPQLLSAVKGAVKNMDRALLLSVLSTRHEIPGDVWVYLLNKIIGVRLVAGAVHLVPNVTLTGDFRLSFDYNGGRHEFNIVHSSGGCVIDYGEQKRHNFMALPTDKK